MASKRNSHSKKLDPKFRGKPEQGGFSPATMRKNQIATMGQHASIDVVEDAVRAVEDGVLSELKTDKDFKERVAKLKIRSESAIALVDRTEATIEEIGSRLKAVREVCPNMSLDMDSVLTKAFIMQSKLAMKASNTLSATDKDTLYENLEEAEKILSTLVGVGDKRNDILMHALNGLANAKVAKATGITERPEVISQLYNLLQESQTLEVPHNNAQVRLNHCLKICERIISQQVGQDDIDKLTEQVVKLEGMVEHARKTAVVDTVSGK